MATPAQANWRGLMAVETALPPSASLWRRLRIRLPHPGYADNQCFWCAACTHGLSVHKNFAFLGLCDVIRSVYLQAVFNGWSSFQNSLSSRRGRRASSDAGGSSDDEDRHRSGTSTPNSGGSPPLLSVLHTPAQRKACEQISKTSALKP